MIFTTQHPGSWQEFMMKPENKALPIQEATRKYNSQMLMFENQYSTFLQQQQQLQSQSSSGGGPRQAPPRPLILEYTITSPDTTISIPLGGANFTEYNFDVNWGDGEIVEGLVGNNSNLNAQMVHTYVEPGVYNIEILGTFPYTYLYGGTNKNLLTDIKQWGTTKWESFAESFRGCTGLTNITATDAPDLTRLKTQPINYTSDGYEKADLFNTFMECTNLTNLNFTSNWDMTQVRVMTQTFRGCTGITDFSTLSKWNMNNVEYLNYFMVLNGQFGDDDAKYMENWRVGNLKRIALFGAYTSITHLDFMSNWNPSQLTNLRAGFNQILTLTDINGLSNWDVSNVTDISFLFRGNDGGNSQLASLSGLENWDISNVTSIEALLYNQQNILDYTAIESWDFSNVENASFAFQSNFGMTSIDTSAWKFPKVTNVLQMFYNNRNLPSLDVSTWDMSSLINGRYLFYNADQNLTTLTGIENWNVGNVDSFHRMFQNCKRLGNLNIGNWDVSNASTIREMLYDCDGFNTSLANWDVNQITEMTSLMAAASGMSTTNYDATLISWAAQIPLAYNGTLNFGGSKYTAGGAAEAARTALIADVGAISDGGAAL